MGHTVKMKKGTSNLVMLLLLNMNCSNGDISYKKSFRPLPEHDGYQRDKLLIFVQSICPWDIHDLGMLWTQRGFLHPLEPHTKLDNKQTCFLLFCLPSEIAVIKVEAHNKCIILIPPKIVISRPMSIGIQVSGDPLLSHASMSRYLSL